MHGSPLSRYDNRLLWKKYNYRDFGITGEPYFDTDFGDVFYLTDTGRRWDGELYSLRDRVSSEKQDQGFGSLVYSSGNRRFHSSSDLINAANESRMPLKMMITLHPQRWDDHFLPWLGELLWQNIKNAGKRIIRILPAGYRPGHLSA